MKACIDCGAEVGSRAKRCPEHAAKAAQRSREKYAERNGTRLSRVRPCSGCGGPKPSIRGQRLCEPCSHGRVSTYHKGCRCDLCSDAKSADGKGRYQNPVTRQARIRNAAKQKRRVAEALALVRKLESEGVI